MTTSVQDSGLEASQAAPRAQAVPCQPVTPVATPPTTSVRPGARTPTALMGLGTQALATALVVRSCPPGHLRTALDALGDPATR